MANHNDPQERRNLVAWLQLLRVSAVPSAVTNILAGFLIANRSWQPSLELMALLACSALLYMSGMVLNDWCDVEIDMQQRPRRPLPSGRITRRAAVIAYLTLTAIGLCLAGLAGTKSLGVAIMLVVAILTYNLLLKKSRVAPIAMGLCRALNILLGASVSDVEHASQFLGWPILAWWIAISVGILITGLTWFARNESTIGTRNQLVSSAMIILAGIVALGVAGFIGGAGPVATESVGIRYAIIVSLISLPILLRLAAAVASQQPIAIQTGVITVLRSLILFDAAICFLVAPEPMIYSIVTAVCLLPALLMSRWVSST